MRRTAPIYYATDKDRFDLMMSEKRKLGPEALRSFALSKGIFLSGEDDKEYLASFLSMMPHDYFDLQHLLHLAETASRAEKITSEKLVGKVTAQDIETAIRTYADLQRQTGTMDNLVVCPKADGRMALEVKYTELDLSKSTLSQRQEKFAAVEAIKEGDEVTLRMPDSEKGREIARGIRDILMASKTLERRTIDLAALKTADERTLFFTQLITKLDGLRFTGVSNVSVVHFGSEQKPTDEDGEGDESNLEETGAEAEMMCIVRKAALDGENVLSSPEYQNLKSRGFYLAKVVWRCELKSSQPDIIEFEAGFGASKEGSTFRYNVKGAFKFIEKKGLAIQRRQMPNDEREGYMAILERVSHTVFDSIIASRSPKKAKRAKAIAKE